MPRIMPTAFPKRRHAHIAVLILGITAISTACGARTSDTSAPSNSTVMQPATNSLRTVLEFDDPVALVERSSNDDFAFVVSRKGHIEKWSYGTTDTTRVLDVAALTNPGGEQGLLGLAFRNDKAYINYTNTDGDTVVAEYSVQSDGMFDASSRRELLVIDQPYANHNGGALATGPDNMLYIAMGDGGSANDPDRVAQSTSSLLGKLLRIDPTPSSTAPYSIPADNPYGGVDGARPEIWAVGLRNPWRFSFDDDGNIWIADVGQNKWEEIDFAAATAEGAAHGANFGWSAFEGKHRFNDDQSANTRIDPVYEYAHGDGACSVSGGVRVNSDSTLTSLRGQYVFGDFCSRHITALAMSGNEWTKTTNVVSGVSSVVAVQQTAHGLYVLSLDGTIQEVVTAD